MPPLTGLRKKLSLDNYEYGVPNGTANAENNFNQKETGNMNTRNIFTKLSIAIALVALLASGVIWEIRRVHAVNPPDPDRFGMVGITRGQTMRLNIVNLV